jgi:hypothetical protein
MTALRVIASVEPLLATQLRAARRHGLDEITIPVGRAVNIMRELQYLRDTLQREQRKPIRDIHPI